ncbi:hypothetical protein KCQ71_11540 [Ruania sp. N2-46]|uniref:Uncharacterized protein n=1 Tax=Occultella gossypii TaxID=2800820 RepID=A0ABS7S994_9MICO|nr:hypothetical protein [Occultella gossypii]
MFIPLGVVAFGGLFTLILGEENSLLAIGIGLILGGVACFFAGRWFQDWDAERRTKSYMVARQAEVDATVASGRFQPVPGYQPRDHAEAQQLAGQMLEREQVTVKKQLRNRHTIFFIPMQYFGIVLAAVGLIPIFLNFSS